MKYKINYLLIAREFGTVIDGFCTRKEAEKELKRHEKEDKNDGMYSKNYYEIIKKTN